MARAALRRVGLDARSLGQLIRIVGVLFRLRLRLRLWFRHRTAVLSGDQANARALPTTPMIRPKTKPPRLDVSHEASASTAATSE